MLSSLAHLLLSRRMSGPAMSTVLRLLDGGPAVRLIARLVQHKLGVADLRGLDLAFRTELPLTAAPLCARPQRQVEGERLGPLPLPGASGEARPWPRSAAVLHDAYKRGHTDPSAVLSRLQQAAARLDLHHRRSPVLHHAPGAAADAAAAALAYRAYRDGGGNGPPSPLCGVPVAIKEEVAVFGLPLRLGTSFLPDTPAPADATLVARLRRAGAIIAFSAPMTEYGLSPFGVSAQRTLPWNPHQSGHSAGGSSTGPGVAVATGLCPLAIGTDGGGSVRIPSSLCGVFGLKPTFGRLSRTGDPYGGSMDHLGPLGASVADLAAFLSVTAGPDPDDPATAFAPPIPQHDPWSQAIGRGVRGLRIGLCDELWRRCDADVAHACMAAVDRLCQEGAQRVAVDLPLAVHAPAIGAVTFGLEMLAALRVLNPDPRLVGADLRLSLTFLAHFPPDSYIDAQRLRGGLRLQMRDALRTADVLALPTTAVVAPPLSETEMEGLVDLDLVDALSRFTFLGNLTGLPALSAPVGRKNGRLPIGLQIYGDAWDEATVLATAAHLERIGAARLERPPVAIDLLTEPDA